MWGNAGLKGIRLCQVPPRESQQAEPYLTFSSPPPVSPPPNTSNSLSGFGHFHILRNLERLPRGRKLLTLRTAEIFLCWGDANAARLRAPSLVFLFEYFMSSLGHRRRAAVCFIHTITSESAERRVVWGTVLRIQRAD